jgi:hypothetical protein
MKADVDYKLIVSKTAGGSDTFKEERTFEKKKRWVHSFKLGAKRSALGNLPEDETKFPITTWFKSFLGGNVQHLLLEQREAAPHSAPRVMKGCTLPDGSNLPWVVADLEKKDTPGFHSAGRSMCAPHCRICWPVYRWRAAGYPAQVPVACITPTTIEVPSWLASDGTLRLLGPHASSRTCRTSRART